MNSADRLVPEAGHPVRIGVAELFLREKRQPSEIVERGEIPGSNLTQVTAIGRVVCPDAGNRPAEPLELDGLEGLSIARLLGGLKHG